MHIDFVSLLVVGFIFNVVFHCALCVIVYINTQYFYIQTRSLEVAYARQNDMGTVLVVDDAKFMRAVLTKIIAQSGHEVVAEACNGDEAIQQFQQVQPDLVLMDIVMPPGPKAKNGIDALKQIVMANPQAKIVMVSSYGQQALITEALKAGAKDFIVKPFQPQKVMEALTKYCC